MWWNHPGAATFRGWAAEVGMHLEHEEFVPEGSTGHQLVVASAPT